MNKVRGLKKTWYKNGTIKEIFYTLSGKKHGEYKMFSEDGSILVSCAYKDGKISGVLQEFNTHLNIKTNKNLEYKNGLRHGEQYEYVDGKLYKKYKCYKGALTGEYLTYHSNEEVHIKCNLVDGELNGKLTMYDKGVKRLVYNYKKGKLHGECIKYENSTYMVGYFCDGLPIKKWKEVDKNGKTIRVFVSSRLLGESVFKNMKWEISM